VLAFAFAHGMAASQMSSLQLWCIFVPPSVTRVWDLGFIAIGSLASLDHKGGSYAFDYVSLLRLNFCFLVCVRLRRGWVELAALYRPPVSVSSLVIGHLYRWVELAAALYRPPGQAGRLQHNVIISRFCSLAQSPKLIC
jgi:hypothetical protein